MPKMPEERLLQAAEHEDVLPIGVCANAAPPKQDLSDAEFRRLSRVNGKNWARNNRHRINPNAT